MSRKSTTHRSDEIARRAYAIWEQAGRPHGRAVEHWLEAEAQLGLARDVRVDATGRSGEGHAESGGRSTGRYGLVLRAG